MIRRILLAGVILLFVAVAGLALVISNTSECPTTPVATSGGDTMSAVISRCYGSPDVLEYTTVDKPVPEDNEVLVKVAAAGVNPLDWHYMRGSPYFLRLFAGIGAPDDYRLGVDFAGTVVAVGPEVTRFEVGDEIFGGAWGAFGEYVVRHEDRALALKPDNVSFEEAAGVPIAAVTALQAVHDHGKLQPGQRVLINGASGGVGTYAVQIAKDVGAHVSAVCSGRNIEMVKSIGADQVFNYKEENYIESGQSFDLIIDMIGNHGPLANRSLLKPDGRLVLVGGAKGNWLAPLYNAISTSLLNPFVSQEMMSFTAQMSAEAMETLATLMAEGKVKTVIDKVYPLAETAEAVRYSESGRARGKIVISHGDEHLAGLEGAD
ncbi:MAG: NAD(P)-dependent alcohol dehydrogenase [Halieaceae bacterium]|nr:NAD(P)-dependent alcohol dehydrogenase [Halieaceae bacterium]